MQLTEFHAFQTSADQQGVLFYYSGYFSQTVVTAMGDALRQRLNHHDSSHVARRRLFSVFVELAQNVVHYSADPLTSEAANDREIRRGAMWIGAYDGKFVVVCANPLQRAHQERMREKLEPLRRMSLAEIKSRYKEQRHADSDAHSKGAGLGFLTVARDASEPIEFEFADSDDSEYTMFYLKATI